MIHIRGEQLPSRRHVARGRERPARGQGKALAWCCSAVPLLLWLRAA